MCIRDRAERAALRGLHRRLRHEGPRAPGAGLSVGGSEGLVSSTGEGSVAAVTFSPVAVVAVVAAVAFGFFCATYNQRKLGKPQILCLGALLDT